ncbi:hypothetical protein [Nannocystis sp.]|uniref:hypothetical protein n=1 Tax=Nannocystis sp. TaxID=1962667 RepID=UPI0025DF3223|nr:hypothetical protein [Nannocystis sp.]MBK7826045.1 hypothetical protein [Nannocystis sp.]
MSLARSLSLAPLALLLTGPGCFLANSDQLSNIEMREALDEVVLEGQGQSVENEIIEITTDFTIGAGVAEAAAALRDAIASQIPCSTITADNDTLTIDFGVLGDECVYNGHTFAGVVTITIAHDPASKQTTVDHSYQDLTNGVVTLNGSKLVTWTDAARHVVSDLDVERDGKTAHTSSDRTQTLLDPAAGLLGGIEINGERDWDNDKGNWKLAIDGVELRWIDPVPQAGSYTLTTPKGKTAVLGFSRVDDDTIAVTLSGGRTDRVFHVTSTGVVSDEGDA